MPRSMYDCTGAFPNTAAGDASARARARRSAETVGGGQGNDPDATPRASRFGNQASQAGQALTARDLGSPGPQAYAVLAVEGPATPVAYQGGGGAVNQEGGVVNQEGGVVNQEGGAVNQQVVVRGQALVPPGHTPARLLRVTNPDPARPADAAPTTQPAAAAAGPLLYPISETAAIEEDAEGNVTLALAPGRRTEWSTDFVLGTRRCATTMT
ncbi:hypothetical protein G6O67_004912 [Ophiocordyceps sinensis]|uniref:Uncharacterized protein n=1 Tax=Ophiocordyceps sinensis TaxID=72228 RepID=A0A8H4V5K2_9HYPO|nr:hypothetical protein G6O67_004912 [Ophiocordyceps sinensis]